MHNALIETQRLWLAPITLDDAPLHLAICNDPDFIKFVRDKGIRTLAQARADLAEKVIPHYQQHGHGNLKVMRKDDDLAIGCCGLFKRDYLPYPDIGYAFLPIGRGAGYVTEAALAVRDYAFTQLQVSHLMGITTPDHQRSIAVLERIGLRLKGQQKLDGDDELLSIFEMPPPLSS